MKISVVIPTYNEGKHLPRLIKHLQQNGDPEIVIADGMSEDESAQIAEDLGAKVVQCKVRSRAHQLNKGAELSSGDTLYFVHADTLPPDSYHRDIKSALARTADLGCYRFKFDSAHPLLRINSYFTRFDRLWCRGGDQSLFIRRTVFEKLGGFDERCLIMEEYDVIERARRAHRFEILPKDIIVSARKYEDNGYLRVQLANLMVFQMYRRNCPYEDILTTYRKRLNYRS